ncbi:MAG: cytochrome c oxidase accessory protein CcoG [Pseudobdellovibrio sp.]
MDQKLDSDRLGSLDDLGHRKAMIPAEVHGIWRKRRDISQAFLILLFLILPWTKINGVQTVLLDISLKKFQLFGATFWSHDAPLVFFILIIAAIGLAFVTSIWGRVWCGWACPQTVFIDGLFRRVEILIEGTHLKRRQLLAAPMSFEKFFKKSSKWVIFFILCSVISHSFIAYFVGADALLKMIQNSPNENMSYFTLVASITGLLLFNFGWFKEQFCIIMCPYGRIQSVLMDQNSMAVLYDEKRGEPRKSPSVPAAAQGDCVACNKCVQVCPTGIDIRKGIQLECIACAACVDACNEIMTKVNKPLNLIRYSSESGVFGKIKSFRSFMYLSIIIVSVIVLVYQLSTRQLFQATVLRGKDLPYSLSKNEKDEEIVVNHFRLHLKNQAYEQLRFNLSLIQGDKDQDSIELAAPVNNIELKAGEDSTVHFFIKSKKQLTSGVGSYRTQLLLKVIKGNDSLNSNLDLQLTGPL